MTENFTGADIGGLICAAKSRALEKQTVYQRGVQDTEITCRVVVNRDVLEKFMLCMSDFLYALKNMKKNGTKPLYLWPIFLKSSQYIFFI